MANIRYPNNAKTYSDALYEIATADLIPTDALSEVVSVQVGEEDKSEENFDAEEYLSDGTIEQGYDSSNLIENGILVFAIVAVLVVLIIFIIIMRFVCCKV